MDNTYIAYAKQMDQIGNEIKKASQCIKTETPENYSEALLAVQNYKDCIPNFRQMVVQARNIVSPIIVTEKHQELIKALEKFIKGMEIVSKSISLDPPAFYRLYYVQGLALIKEAEIDSIRISTLIGDKLME